MGKTWSNDTERRTLRLRPPFEELEMPYQIAFINQESVILQFGPLGAQFALSFTFLVAQTAQFYSCKALKRQCKALIRQVL